MTRPLLLALAAAVAVPVLLHLWTRSRPRRLDWATWRFLPRPDPAESRVIRLDQPLLLVLRMLAVALLAAAAAGPTCSQPATGGSELTGLTNPVFVVDLSASMGQGESGDRPLDRAADMLDRMWRRYRWAEGAVVGCKGSRAEQLYDGADVLPRRFLGSLLDAAHLGGAELEACVAGAAGADRDLVVVSDRPAPTPAPAWLAGRSVHWFGAAPADPVRNRGLGEVEVVRREQTVRIRGTVAGNAGAEHPVRLRWRIPERPVIETMSGPDGSFAFELLAPRAAGRLVLDLPGEDAAAWDDVVPVWIPSASRPEVHLDGALDPRAESKLLDLLYAARGRIRLVMDGEEAGDGGRLVYVLYHPDRLGAQRRAELEAAVESGATAIVFPRPSGESSAAKPIWVPGWLHPAQATRQPQVQPTAAVARRWPNLEGLDWSAVQVRRIMPLAEPQPGVEVLLETDHGLPALTHTRVGRGDVFTFMVGLGAGETNMAQTPVWAPLWLAMLDVLQPDVADAALIPVGAELGLDRVRRVDTAYSGAGMDTWLGWLTGNDRRGGTRQVALRVPADEVDPGTASGLTTLKAADEPAAGGAEERSVPTTAWWLAAAMGFWLLQGIWSQVRGARVAAGFLLALAGAALAPAPAAAEEANTALKVWVPQESAPSSAQIEGAKWALSQWRRRSSPALAAAPESFAWRATDPADPWVWWLGCRSFDPAADAELSRRVESFLRGQGTLWVDTCGGPVETERQAERIAAWAEDRGLGAGWRRLPTDHVLFRTFYLLERWRDPENVERVYALRVDGMERLFLVPNLARGYAKEPMSGWNLPMSGSEREWLLRQGLNLLLYTTTYDYKNDSIHLPYILERRRRHR